jgi:hypothetical protein
MCIQLSPLNPLKGRIAANKSLTLLAAITPLRGMGVNSVQSQFECLFFFNLNIQ